MNRKYNLYLSLSWKHLTEWRINYEKTILHILLIKLIYLLYAPRDFFLTYRIENRVIS